MRAAVVVSDLILFSRVASAAARAGVSLARVDSPAELPDALDLVLVDWSGRAPDWTDALRDASASRIILFGPHTDGEAHDSARAAGLGPMWARSKLLAELPILFGLAP